MTFGAVRPRERLIKPAVALLGAALLLAVVGLTVLDGQSAANVPVAGLTLSQRRIVDALVSDFEQGTLAPDYCDVEALGDGRGYTVGRGGLTSADGDLLEFVRAYTAVAPGNPLARLLPRLELSARAESASTANLAALPAAWRATCNRPLDRTIQDRIVDELYFDPALRLWHQLGLRTPLSLAAFYDAMIQHGGGDDPDGVPALVRSATARAGGTPATGISEARFLTAFLAVRRADLAHASDPSTRAVWAQSVARVDVFFYLLRTGQWQLAAPVDVRTADYQVRLGTTSRR
jgi:chitosanase